MSIFQRASARFVLVTFAFTPLSAYTKTREISDYWKATPLSFSHIEERVNTDTCYRDADNFLGCINAINSLISFSKTPMALIPKDASDRTRVKTVLKDYGTVQLVELEPAKKDSKPVDVIAAFEKAKAERKQRLVEWNGLFQSTKNASNSLGFTEMLSEFEKDARAQTEHNEAEMTAAAINQYLATVFDPHTYIQPTAYVEDSYNGDANENFFGIGAILRSLDAGVSAEPMEGSPAVQAGLRNKDIITHVDGTPISGKTLDAVVKMIRGPEKTSVKLTILRKGKTLTITIVRGPIVNKNVTSKLLQTPRSKLGYIKFNSFMERAGCSQIAAEITRLEATGSQGYILDLRGNGGGLLDQSVCIANLFLKEGTPVVEQRPLNKTQKSIMLSTRSSIRTSAPLVVLINAGSASASEILSGALQDHARAVLVGERSFGKGSVQGVTVLPTMKEVAMAKTIARFYQPSGRTNQVVGISPDIEVYSNPTPTAEDRFAYREEDLYTNALPPVGPKWTQPRPSYVAGLETCRKNKGTAQAEFKAREDDAIPADYQLLVAQDTLNCMLLPASR